MWTVYREFALGYIKVAGGKLFPSSSSHLSNPNNFGTVFFIALSLVYVPSRDNLMDAPSGALSASTCPLFLRDESEIEKGTLIPSFYWS